MEDTQGQQDDRCTAIDQVGVSGVRYPMVVLDRTQHRQHTIGTFTISVGLPHYSKGTHMSRFLELLNEHEGEMTRFTIPHILATLKQRLQAESARLEVIFPYFLERRAPVSQARGLLDYECSFTAESNASGDDFVLGVQVPVTSVCPCSKAISDYGAHNQRGYVSIKVRTPGQTEASKCDFVWIEELIDIAERSASAPVFPVLKRPDERFVTMQAYDRAVFVEDMVRDVAVQLKADPRIVWFHVDAVNHESIHSHNAFAQLEWCRLSQQGEDMIGNHMVGQREGIPLRA